MKKNKIHIKDLKSGMILGMDIIQNNSVLLYKGTVLNNMYIEKLQYLKLEDEITITSPCDYTSATYKNEYDLQSASNKLMAISKKLKNFLFDKDLESSLKNHNLGVIQDEIISNFELLKVTLKDVFFKTSVDDYLYVHSLNVAFISYLIGNWLHMDKERLSSLITSALLHDIGKSKINPSILYKPSKLTDKEFSTMKKHPLIGHNLIKDLDVFHEDVSMGILTHHERVDGSGYPLKLKSSQIHIFGKIISIADTFSAMTLNRPFKRKISPLKALEIMQEEHFSKYDFGIWDVFYKNMLSYYTGDTVRLNTGEVGKIVIMHPESPAEPVVYIADTYFANLKLDDTRSIDCILEKKRA